MLLALWFDFPPASWVPAPPSTPHISIDGGSSGHPTEYPQVEQWPKGAMFEYLDARAEYLKRITGSPVTDDDLRQRPLEVQNNLQGEVPKVARPSPFVPTRQTILANVRLDGAHKAVSHLQARVAKLERQMEDEAIELLLLH